MELLEDITQQHDTAEEVVNDVTRNTYRNVEVGGGPIDRSDFIISNLIEGDSLQVKQERYFVWELGVGIKEPPRLHESVTTTWHHAS